MHILILSCNTGEGHNSCAKAIREYFSLQGAECEIVDSLGFISQKISRMISNGHSRMYRYAPSVFDKGYKFAEEHDKLFCDESMFFRWMATGAEKLYSCLKAGEYDAVVCTHIFSAIMLTATLAKYPMTLTTCLLATDYTCSPGYSKCDLDYFFIPDLALARMFTDQGVPAEKLICSGIPVRQMFLGKKDQRDAKLHFGVDPDRKHLIVMCGSMGCGPVEEVAEQLAQQMDENSEVTIVCGTNKKLYRRLSGTLAENPRVHILGYVNDIALLMDSADLYLTKPGGISITEAAVKRLPMVLINAVAGCESGNLSFFLDMGAAVTAESPEELASLCVKLLGDSEHRMRMSRAYGVLAEQNAAKIIYDCCAR